MWFRFGLPTSQKSQIFFCLILPKEIKISVTPCNWTEKFWNSIGVTFFEAWIYLAICKDHGMKFPGIEKKIYLAPNFSIVQKTKRVSFKGCLIFFVNILKMPHVTSGMIYDVWYPSLPSRSAFLKLCSAGPLFSARFEQEFREKIKRKTKLNSVALFRERTIPTERQPVLMLLY